MKKNKYLSNGEKNEEIFIEKNSIKELENGILKEASIFASWHNAFLPYDYIDDCIDPCFDDDCEYIEGCHHVYIEFVDSNIFDEDSFEIFWDNYMKAFGRGRM